MTQSIKIFTLKQYCLAIFPIIGFFIGKKLDDWEDERLTRYRDKSALYRRDVPPETPSW